MADDFLKGFQVGSGAMSNALELNLRRQQLQSQSALQRLQEQQIAQAMALKMQENALQNQFRAEMTTAAQAMQDATAEEIMIPMEGADVGTSVRGSDMAPPLMPMKNPAPMRRIDAFTQFMLPVIMKYQPDKAGSIYNDVIANEVRMQQEQPFNPEIKQIPRPGGGTAEVLTTSPKSAQLMTPGPNIIEKDGQQFYQSGPNTFTRIPTDIGARQTKQKMLDIALKNPDLAIDDPDNPGGKIIPPENWALAAQRMSLQPGTRGQLEQQQISAENVFAIGRRFLPLLNDQTVGIPGFWNREVKGRIPFMDKIFGTEGVAESVAAESVGRQFMANIVKTLRSDSNISEPERKTLEQAAPDPTRLVTRPNTEKIRLYEFLVNAATLSRSNAVRKGTQITPMFLTLDEISVRVPDTERPPDRARGEITEQEAKDMWENSATAMIQQLRREIGR